MVNLGRVDETLILGLVDAGAVERYPMGPDITQQKKTHFMYDKLKSLIGDPYIYER